MGCKPYLGDRQEDILSWLQGLAPVGELIKLDIHALMTDLAFNNRQCVYKLIGKLVEQGYLGKRHTGRPPFRKRPALVVLKRLEDMSDDMRARTKTMLVGGAG